MITATDPKLATALANLRKNPNLGLYINEMERAGVNVTIQLAPPSYQTSATDVNFSPNYICRINAKGDAALALSHWGIKGTTEENSIAHELGHVYWDYLTNIKKKKGLLDGKPAKLTNDQWSAILSEATSRRFDNYSRPAGIIVPTADVKTEGFFEKIKESSTLNPFALY